MAICWTKSDFQEILQNKYPPSYELKGLPLVGEFMAESLLSFGVERLWNLLVRESERFQGVEEQFNGLKSDLNMLRCFLEDADAKKHTSAMVRNTIKEVKEIILDTEDIVETFLLKKKLGNTSGIINNVRRLPRVISERRILAFDMKAISKRISKVIRDMQSLGVQQVTASDGYPQSLQERQREMRETFSNDNENVLVGLDQKVKSLASYVVEEDSSQVVSITGMGGIGKTTLARQVFNHETVKSHFAGLAWVCLSQQFTRDYVWQTILRKLRPECKVSEMKGDELQEKLSQVLETQKVLIVLDDIWREEDWDMIKPMFPRKKGCKVLLTSRNEGWALHADPKCVTFRPKCLTFEESWDLFQRITFPMKDTAEFKVDEEMEEMGKQMIKHCGGLPLALKVLGGLLAAQYTLHEWKRVYKSIGSHIVGGTSFNERNIVYHVLYLSLEELPAYLKYCFLYLAHFPEDYQIDVETLSYYWASEGIPRPPRYYDRESIRDVGDGYIEELVKRNMVVSERDVETSRFETCQLHDMMREVCLRKAEEENFLQIIQGTSTATSKSPCKSRRLSVVRWPADTFDVDTEVKNSSLRTLLFIPDRGYWNTTGLFFTRLMLMRVLDLSLVKFEGGKVPSSIGKLIHLRYLSLKDAYVNHLPSSMRNLKQLLYLNLDVTCQVYMPNILKEMRELTYLYLPGSLHDTVKMELGNLVKLETLKNFSMEHGSLSDLHGMTKLKILSVYTEGKGCSMKTLSSSLSKITHLENLTINNRKKHVPTNEDEGGFVLDSVHLRQLTLEIYMPRLPDAQHFPSHLTGIYLELCRLEEDPMPIMGKLLHLKKVWLGERSFSGKRMVCSRGGFPQLQILQFIGLDEWDEWIVEEGSMPLLLFLSISGCEKLEKWKLEEGSMSLLHILQISCCKNLEEWIVEEGSMRLLHILSIYECKKLKLPDGLRFITSLEDLSVEHIGEKCKLRCLPSHLTTISLTGCRTEEDPMPILEKMVQLKEVLLAKGSFCGRRMVCSRGGFPQLKNLELKELEEWEEWMVEEGSMPLLHTLTIWGCQKLKKLPDGLRFITSLEDLRLPDGLRFITSLKELRVENMREEWKKRLLEGGEDYYKVQHIPSVRLSLWR
ncbi:hypothetical protein Bca52824_031168 [Brassica carinata]|uniref:Disease resistance protein n=1 Tax=Brassica carinata TaxID=52824 RepID=A0A8X7SAR5_BRACI|nr:hypothetical protein Bca52824_031168 [Brassica carinata]